MGHAPYAAGHAPYAEGHAPYAAGHAPNAETKVFIIMLRENKLRFYVRGEYFLFVKNLDWITRHFQFIKKIFTPVSFF